MQFEKLDLPGLIKFMPRKFTDDRGYFMETFRTKIFCDAVGRDIKFLQDNHSTSLRKGTVRGLHFQSPPRAQGKLVRCPRGRVMDVVVDARRGSPSYGNHVAVELSAENGHLLWVPEGFLHGFVTLDDHSDLFYKCTDYYSPEHDGAILWNDPDLGISWDCDPADCIVSSKDARAQTFAAFDSPFIFNP